MAEEKALERPTSHYDKPAGEENCGSPKAAVSTCGQCGECEDCQADLTKARLRRQNSLVTRLSSRVLALLEQAITS